MNDSPEWMQYATYSDTDGVIMDAVDEQLMRTFRVASRNVEAAVRSKGETRQTIFGYELLPDEHGELDPIRVKPIIESVIVVAIPGLPPAVGQYYIGANHLLYSVGELGELFYVDVLNIETRELCRHLLRGLRLLELA